MESIHGRIRHETPIDGLWNLMMEWLFLLRLRGIKLVCNRGFDIRNRNRFLWSWLMHRDVRCRLVLTVFRRWRHRV